ncbi:HEAT repeat domain-containing protein [Microbispora hainanensis]|uniref:HEAT repeat domain-containing protein n=1 Tax=Microbispora hainanensis TaxID=568844 RepID=UPI0033F95FE7
MISDRLVDLLAALGPAGDAALARCLFHPNLHVREMACVKLREIGDTRALTAPDAVPALLTLLDQPGRVSQLAVEAIGALGDLSVLPSLAPYRDAHQEDMRAAVLEAEAKIRSRSSNSVETLRPADQLTQLLNDLHSDDADKRSRAAWALENWPTAEVVDQLFATASQDEEVWPRWAAASSLVHIGSERVVLGLIELLKAEDEQTVAIAAYSLAEIGGARARDALLELFPDASDRASTGRWGPEGEAAILSLEPLTRSADPVKRAISAHVLGDIQSPSSLTTLIGLLRDDDLNVVSAAVRALETVGDPSLADTVFEMVLSGEINSEVAGYWLWDLLEKWFAHKPPHPRSRARARKVVLDAIGGQASGDHKRTLSQFLPWERHLSTLRFFTSVAGSALWPDLTRLLTSGTAKERSFIIEIMKLWEGRPKPKGMPILVPMSSDIKASDVGKSAQVMVVPNEVSKLLAALDEPGLSHAQEKTLALALAEAGAPEAVPVLARLLLLDELAKLQGGLLFYNPAL